ncbi:uncharacterized protein LOC131152932 isoform X2 [Malania oleifera]|nr:uncharacterized protein LOC131152932 isoform X2 [Malania oleifera]
MMGITVQCLVDLMVAGISLMFALGIFALVASVLCSAAFFLNTKDFS